MDIGKLFSFDGRLGRGPFWIISIVATIVYFIGFALVQSEGVAIVLGLVLLLLALVVSLATQVKRWHDRDKSGWWIFISFVPFIGGLWALIEAGFLGGTSGDNRFGTPSSGSPLSM